MSSLRLAIDVAEEVRALSSTQLRATWQVPAELVRLAVRLGAKRVQVERRKHGFFLRAEGAFVDGARIEDLAVALEPTRAPDARHGALLRLEAAEIQALLWAAGMERPRLRVESSGSVQWTRLRVGGGVVGVDRAPTGPGEEWFEVRLAARAFDSRRALAWLRTAARFCPVPVVVDGEACEGTFEGALLEGRCRDPLPARFAVTRDGDAPRLWLLTHGVLAAQATVPGWPPFAAAVELAGAVRPFACPDELLEAVRPHLGGLAARVVDTVLAAADRLPDLPEPARERLVCVLLRGARAGVRRERILDAALLRVVDGHGGGVRWRSARELKELAAGGTRLLAAVARGQRTASGDGDGSVSVVLTTEERFLLGELLDLSRGQPSDRERVRPSIRSSVRRACRWLHPGRWRPGRRRIVPSDELLEAELGLLAVLNAQLAPPLEARLCAGDGAVLRRRNRLLLPRQNPLVVRALRLASAERSWLYPVALALLGEDARPSAELRDRWRRRCLGLSGAATPPAAELEEVG